MIEALGELVLLMAEGVARALEGSFNPRDARLGDRYRAKHPVELECYVESDPAAPTFFRAVLLAGITVRLERDPRGAAEFIGQVNDRDSLRLVPAEHRPAAVARGWSVRLSKHVLRSHFKRLPKPRGR